MPLLRFLRPIALLRIVIVIVTACLFLKLLEELILSPRSFHPSPHLSFTKETWTSPYSGWYNRSTLIPNPRDVHIDTSKFYLIHTSSNWGRDFPVVVFFSPGYAATTKALVKLNEADFSHFVTLSERVINLNIESGKRFGCSQVRDLSTAKLEINISQIRKQFAAYAFRRATNCRGDSRLPDVLWELFGLLVRVEFGNWVSDGEGWITLKEEFEELARETRGREKQEWRRRVRDESERNKEKQGMERL